MANLLAWFKYPVGDGAFYAAFGFVFVFLGIAILVFLFTMLGLAMKKINARKPKKKKIKTKEKEETAVNSSKVEAEEEISPEIVAVITAAVAAVYEGENVKCDFVVRKIRKL